MLYVTPPKPACMLQFTRLNQHTVDSFIGAVGVLFQMGSAPVGCVKETCRHALAGV